MEKHWWMLTGVSQTSKATLKVRFGILSKLPTRSESCEWLSLKVK